MRAMALGCGPSNNQTIIVGSQCNTPNTTLYGCRYRFSGTSTVVVSGGSEWQLFIDSKADCLTIIGYPGVSKNYLIKACNESYGYRYP